MFGGVQEMSLFNTTHSMNVLNLRLPNNLSGKVKMNKFSPINLKNRKNWKLIHVNKEGFKENGVSYGVIDIIHLKAYLV